MAATLQGSKKAMRKAIGNVLRSLPNTEIQTQSAAVTNHLLSSSWFQRCNSVCCYLSMPTGEIDTSPLVNAVLQSGVGSILPILVTEITHNPLNCCLIIVIKGKSLYVPKIDITVNGRMDMMKTFGDDDLKSFPSGVWGIKEPSPDWNGSSRPSALKGTGEALDLILMPGVAFDLTMSRLGHGKGYYDRFITNYSSLHEGRKPVLVALALREQILEAGKVPVGAHDWKVDFIVGPDGVFPGAKDRPLES